MSLILRTLALGAVALGAVSPAWAATGLEWQWNEGEERRYRVSADVKMPQILIFSKEYNKDVRVYDYAFAVDVTCTPARSTNKGWDVSCDVTSAQWNAQVAKNDLNIGREVLDEWDQKLVDNATIVFELTSDGRVRDFDLEGLNERNQRIRLIKETMRPVLMRGFAAFDLNLPKKGEADSPWKQKTDLAFSLPVITGMVGSTRAMSEVVEEDGTTVTIDTTGRGTMRVDPLPGSDARLAADNYDGEIRSRSVFDTASGNLLERSYIVQSNLTPGSGSAVGGVEQTPYIQGVQLTYVPDGTPMDMLGDNKAEAQ